MYHYEKNSTLPTNTTNIIHTSKKIKKRRNTCIETTIHGKPKKKPNEWNNISDYIFVFTDIQNCDGHCNGDCDGKTDPL